MSKIMSNRLSSSETLQAIATHDWIVWGQIRILPIELDKELNSAKAKYKNLTAKSKLGPIVEEEANLENKNLASTLQQNHSTATTYVQCPKTADSSAQTPSAEDSNVEVR